MRKGALSFLPWAAEEATGRRLKHKNRVPLTALPPDAGSQLVAAYPPAERMVLGSGQT